MNFTDWARQNPVGVDVDDAAHTTPYEYAARAHAAAVAAERERCRQIFLALAEDEWGWRLKSGHDASVRWFLEQLDSESGTVHRRRFVEKCPENHGLPAIVGATD